MSSLDIATHRESFEHLLEVFPTYIATHPGKWIATTKDRVLGPVDSPEELHALLNTEKINRKHCAFTILDQRTMLL